METTLELLIHEISITLGSSPLRGLEKHHGCAHDILVLKSPSGTTWILRIAKDDSAADVANRDVDIMEHILDKRPALPIPAIIHTVQRYSILTFIEGIPLLSWHMRSLSDQRRHSLLRGFARFLHQLWTCPAPVETKCPHRDHRDWLLDEVDLAICRSATKSDRGNPIYFLQRRAWAHELVPIQTNFRLAISHGDLNALNVLAKEDGLTGIIDWDTVSWVPAPAAVHHPLFMANVPDIRLDGAPEDMSFDEDRAYLEASIRKICGDDSDIADFLSTSPERQFFELFLRNKRVNYEYIRRRCDSIATTKDVLSSELEALLRKHTGMANNPTVAELRAQLALTNLK